jgi:hypothetical protein
MAGGRQAGGNPVVDHHRGAARHLGPRPVAPEAPGLAVQICPCQLLDFGERAGRHPGQAEHLFVEHHYPVLADSAHSNLRLEGDAQLAHHDHIQGDAQRPCHLKRHRHPAAWQR